MEKFINITLDNHIKLWYNTIRCKSLVVFFIYGGDKMFEGWSVLAVYFYLEILFASLSLAIFLKKGGGVN